MGERTKDRVLPVAGLALPASLLEDRMELIEAEQRDVEIGDPAFTPIFDNEFDHLPIAANANLPWLLEDWRTITRRVNGLLSGYTGRIGIHGPFVGIPTFAVDRKIRDICRQRFNQALEFAAEIRATQMVVHSPWEFFGGPFVPHSTVQSSALVIDLAVDLLSEVLPNAREANCTIVFESIFDKRPGPLLDVVRRFDSPHVRFSIDFGHVYVNHLMGGPPPDQWIRDAGSLLVHTHLQDTDGAADRHWPVGRGAINWFAVFEALHELEEMPRLILEEADHRWSINWLRQEGFAR